MKISAWHIPGNRALLVFLIPILMLSSCQKKPEPEPIPVPGPIESTPSIPTISWEFLVGGKLPERMVVIGNEILLADSKGDLIALSLDEGIERTVFHIPGQIMGWDIDGDLVVSSGIDKNIHLNNILDGEELWSSSCESTPAPPVFTKDGVIFAEGIVQYRVRYHSRVDGKLIWKREFHAKPGGFAPVVNEEMAFFGFGDRMIRALSLEDGDVDWKFKIEKPMEIHSHGRWSGRYDFLGEVGDLKQRRSAFQVGGIGKLVLIPEGLIVPSEDGFLRCINPKNGKLIWEIEFGERVWHAWHISSPSGSRLYCDSIEGQLYRIDPTNGRIESFVDLIEPTTGAVFLGGGIIADVTQEEGTPIVRSRSTLKIIDLFTIGITPIGGIVTGDYFIARTDDGLIVGITLP